MKLCVIIMIICLGAQVRCYVTPTAQIRKALLANHDVEEPPPNSPIELKVGMYLNSVSGFDVGSQDFTIMQYLRQKWTDSRLAWDPNDFHGLKEVMLVDDGKIWTPDLFYRNTITRDHMKGSLMKVKSNGQVWLVQHMRVRLSCPMQLDKFPFDIQRCPILIESFAYTSDTIILTWLDQPIELDKNLGLRGVTVVENVLNNCTQTYTAGTFPCLEIRLVMTRNLGHYVINVFLPCVLLVIISWLAFWLDAEAVTAKVLLTLVPLMGVLWKASSVSLGVSYLTSLDSWMIVHALLLLAALLQVTAVSLLKRNKVPLLRQDGDGGKKVGWVDIISRVLFPIFYIVFNVIYWISVSA